MRLGSSRLSLLVDLGQDLGISDEEVLLEVQGKKSEMSVAHLKVLRTRITTSRQSMKTHILADLDAVAAPARKEDLVSDLDARRNDLAILIGDTGAGSDDAGLGKRRLCGSRGQEETRSRLGLGLEALNQDAVEEGHDRLDAADCRLLWQRGSPMVSSLFFRRYLAVTTHGSHCCSSGR